MLAQLLTTAANESDVTHQAFIFSNVYQLYAIGNSRNECRPIRQLEGRRGKLRPLKEATFDSGLQTYNSFKDRTRKWKQDKMRFIYIKPPSPVAVKKSVKKPDVMSFASTVTPLS